MLLKLSTARTVLIVMVASSDHIAGATGKTLTIYASKAGATPAAITPTVVELDSTNMPGFYSLALTTTHTNTLGDLGLHITATGCDPTSITYQVATDLPGDSIASIGTGGITSASYAANAITAAVLADGAIDNATFAADTGAPSVRSSTAQAGAAGTITLDASASSVTDFYAGSWIRITGGTGAGQTRLITAYNGTTKVATIGRNWATNPDGTSTFAVLPAGAIIQVSGSVDSVANRVTANTDQLAGQTVTAAAGVTFPTSVASPTNITAGTITTATNLTNAPTSGDLTATMKASVTTAATAATPTAAAVTADVGITQTAADKVWGTTTRALTDKVGFALSAAGVQAIWDALTSALTTVGSIGKRIADNLDATISSRSSYAGGDTSGTTTLLSRLTGTRAGLLDNLDAAMSSRLPTSSYTAPPTASANAVAVVDQALSGHTTAGTVGGALNSASSAGDPWATALPGAYGSGTAGNILGNRLDQAVGTRLATSGYTTPPTAAANATALLDASLSGHTTSGTAGAALTAAAAAGDPWSTAVPGSYGAGTAGAVLASRASQTSVDAVGAKTTNLPASPAASTDAAAALAAAGYTSTRAGRLDHLDVDVSTRSTYAGADTSGTTALLALLTSTRAAKLDHLDVDISTRLAGASYTAPDNTTIAAIDALALLIKAKTDGLPSDPADASDIAAAFGTVNSTLGTLQTALTAVGVDVTAIPDSVWGATLAESYAAQGAEFTPAQALYMIFQLLANREVLAALLTAYKLDGTTAAMTFDLNSATVPTAQTRAT